MQKILSVVIAIHTIASMEDQCEETDVHTASRVLQLIDVKFF
jgi:hypothetical protein